MRLWTCSESHASGLDLTPSLSISQVSAVDADLGPSGELEYSILQDEGLMPARDYLKIDSATGIIRVKHVLQHTSKLLSGVTRAWDAIVILSLFVLL